MIDLFTMVICRFDSQMSRFCVNVSGEYVQRLKHISRFDRRAILVVPPRGSRKIRIWPHASTSRGKNSAKACQRYVCTRPVRRTYAALKSCTMEMIDQQALQLTQEKRLVETRNMFECSWVDKHLLLWRNFSYYLGFLLSSIGPFSIQLPVPVVRQSVQVEGIQDGEQQTT